MALAISIENLSKQYQLGLIGGTTLAGDFERWFAQLRGLPDPRTKIAHEQRPDHDSQSIWALRNVSFDVGEGEVLGIIGRNGAGKSTLLKILSRITAPTSGKIKVRGRVGSLLEVGTGFHPELTGRENIYLNGAVLGMKRDEIKRRFDDIVAFSEIGQFIDTPVKRYSSGMYVRLAFAVAAHLEPEILVVDEVLAVGDAAFQKKCLGKMREVATEGRTVLFTSHNMGAVRELCSTGIVLDKGGVALEKSSSSDAVDFYHHSIVGSLVESPLELRQDRIGSGKLKFTNVEFLNSDGRKLLSIACGQSVKIRLYYRTKTPVDNLSVAVSFGSHSGENKLLLSTDFLKAGLPRVDEIGYFECSIPRLPLSPGAYLINIFCRSGSETLDWIRDVRFIEVQEGDYHGNGKYIPKGIGQCALAEHTWQAGRLD